MKAKPWTFVIAADTQVGSPKSFRYAPAWAENWKTARRQICAINPDLLLIAGDLVRDGFNQYELEEFKQDLDALPFPVHTIVGNMDSANKPATHNSPVRRGENGQFSDIELTIESRKLIPYANVFGDLCWSFVHRGVRFTGIADVVINSGIAEEKALWKRLDELARQPKEDHHVWIMHYAPFINEPGEGNWDIKAAEHYNDWYFSINEPGRSRLIDLFKRTAGRKQTIVASGHIHCRRHQMFDGIQYDKAPATCFPQWADRWPDGDATLGFLRYDVDDKGIARTFVPLEELSALPGRGPGGHPNPVHYGRAPAWESGG